MKFIRRMFDRRAAGGKDRMAENTPSAGTQDLAAITASLGKLTEAVTALTSNQAKQQATLAALAESAKKPADASTQAGTTKDGKTVELTLEKIGELIDQKLNSTQKASEGKAARDAYVAEKLKDLPAAYRNQLGNDPTKWAGEEQAIRDQFKSDLKSAGVEPKSLGNASADGGVTPERKPVDRSKMSPMDLLNSDAGAKPAQQAAAS